MSVLTNFTKNGLFPKGTQGAVQCSFLTKFFMHFPNQFSVNFTTCNPVGFVASFGKSRFFLCNIVVINTFKMFVF